MDSKVFREVYNRTSKGVAAQCRRLLFDRNDVDDCVQVVFQKVHTSPGPDQKPDAIDAWVHGIARNVILEFNRKSKRRDIADDLSGDIAAPETDFVSEIKRDELRTSVRALLHMLPRTQRHVMSRHLDLITRRHDNVTGAELAEAIGWPRTRVDRELSRARKSIREGVVVLAVIHPSHQACPQVHALVNKFGLRKTPMNGVVAPARSELLSHARSCEQCRPVVEEAKRWSAGAMMSGLADPLPGPTGDSSSVERLGSLLRTATRRPDHGPTTELVQPCTDLAKLVVGLVMIVPTLLAPTVTAVNAAPTPTPVVVSQPPSNTVPPMAPAEPPIAPSPTTEQAAVEPVTQQPTQDNGVPSDDPSPAEPSGQVSVSPGETPVGQERQLHTRPPDTSANRADPQAKILHESTGSFRLVLPRFSALPTVRVKSREGHGCVLRDHVRSDDREQVRVACSTADGKPTDTDFELFFKECDEPT